MGLRVGSSWKEMLMPSMGMVLAILAIVTTMIVSKLAMSKGLSSFIIVVYSNAAATLILFPACIFIYVARSGSRPLTFSVIWRILLLALNGCFGQICDYVGISYSSPTLATAMLNLIPGFTFILAITFRMEVINWRSWSSYAKAFGTAVSISGAFILTFYRGPQIINQHLTSAFSSQQNWILGGVILACESLSTSLWYIIQASILKIYQEEIMIVCLYCFFVTIISALISLVVERNPSAWTLYPDIRLIAILYSGIIGIAFRSCMTTWCLKKTDPLFVSMFKPLGVVFAVVIGTFCFKDVFYIGSLVGSVTTVVGFYAVMWGKAQEKYCERKNSETLGENVALLQNEAQQV
ncbi:WAT1-related protein At3g28050-like isoform X1 [Lycium ferocissimum]|uniref:WAT1-related protein At3g28050-like isoform X1 n=1 Tax=Lycium ferocissimum TaxID=112874 RepID=UPI0028167610|nr:WAT1-related protein At3g28050-like isoform X1 [Lycium ferocissimum]